MLTKPSLITVIPAVDGRDYRAASETCYAGVPPGTGGDTYPPGTPPPESATNPAAGTPIVLESHDGSGGYIVTESTAPAPAGYVCRIETVFITDPNDPLHTTTQYNTVCTEQ